jgi:hypothetical protein
MNEAKSGLEAVRQRMQNKLRETAGMASPEGQEDSPKGDLPSPVAAPAVSDVTKPILSQGEVLYRSPRQVFNFQYKGKQVSFLYGWLVTSDADLMSYLEKNFPMIKKVG